MANYQKIENEFSWLSKDDSLRSTVSVVIVSRGFIALAVAFFVTFVMLTVCVSPSHAGQVEAKDKTTPQQKNQAGEFIRAQYLAWNDKDAGRWELGSDGYQTHSYRQAWCKPDKRQAVQQSWREFVARIEKTNEARIDADIWKDYKNDEQERQATLTELCTILERMKQGLPMETKEKLDPLPQVKPTPEQLRAGKWIEAEWRAWLSTLLCTETGITGASQTQIWKQSFQEFVTRIEKTEQAEIEPFYTAYLQGQTPTLITKLTEACAERQRLDWEARNTQLQAEADRANAAYAAEAPARYARDLLRETERHNLETGRHNLEMERQQRITNQQRFEQQAQQPPADLDESSYAPSGWSQSPQRWRRGQGMGPGGGQSMGPGGGLSMGPGGGLSMGPGGGLSMGPGGGLSIGPGGGLSIGPGGGMSIGPGGGQSIGPGGGLSIGPCGGLSMGPACR